MTLTHEVRGSLARCLATENIVVEHRNVMTAMFDVEKRVLTLPNWKKASDEVYQMLVLHEISHAIWTDNIDWTINYPEVPKDVVNILEDVRVEKLCKRKYPGSSKHFYNGYNELNADDFFSTKEENLDKLSFIDRINLYYKIGAFHNICFNDEENEYLTRASQTETFDEVLKLAREITEYVKNKKEEQESNVPQLGEHSNSMEGPSGNEGNQEGEKVEQESSEGEEE